MDGRLERLLTVCHPSDVNIVIFRSERVRKGFKDVKRKRVDRLSCTNARMVNDC
jgi:hypothetical protein